MSGPLAYFLTWHTYGTWLPGHERGSVDRDHAIFGEPFAPANSQRRTEARSRMQQQAIHFDEAARSAVHKALVEVYEYRSWNLIALHVRTTHVHCVVRADATAEKMLGDFKAYATRRRRRDGCYGEQDKVWAVHGSTRYLWRPDQVQAAVAYTLDQQGTPMPPAPFHHPHDRQSPER